MAMSVVHFNGVMRSGTANRHKSSLPCTQVRTRVPWVLEYHYGSTYMCTYVHVYVRTRVRWCVLRMYGLGTTMLLEYVRLY